MDSEIEIEYPLWLRVYKNGTLERLADETMVPPSLDPQNSVLSKDVVYSREKNLSVRIFLHQKAVETDKKKLPLLVYFHGGGFVLGTAFCPTYHTFVTSAIAGGADCIAVSVDYRRAPEHLIPIAYEDSWDALEWIFAHISGSGPEDWLNQHADFSKVFLAGDSAGGNIAHHMGIRAGKEKYLSRNFEISGIILIHPYFWSKTPIDDEETTDVAVRNIFNKIWEIASPNSENGMDDPLINVVGSESSDISGLECERVLVMVAGKDNLVRQGLGYAAKLEKSGWKGKVEVVETKDEIHVFHLENPDTDNARRLLQKLAEFLKDERSL